jgi:hypothetical protein
MLQIIAWVGFFIGLIGISFIIKRKISVLSELNYRESSLIERINTRFSFRNILHKILLRFRSLILRTERKTDNLLFELHNKSEKDKFSEDYWRKIKKKK